MQFSVISVYNGHYISIKIINKKTLPGIGLSLMAFYLLSQRIMKIDKIKYYSKNDLLLKDDVPGAKLWAVALEKTMLTYFEIEPNSLFDMHSHESEQITMVISGELFFKTETGETIRIKEGEVIAIPSNIRHSVYTEEKYVKAIDAWSPIREEYK